MKFFGTLFFAEVLRRDVTEIFDALLQLCSLSALPESVVCSENVIVMIYIIYNTSAYF